MKTMPMQSKEDFIRLAGSANLIPVYGEYSAALETPLSVYLKLGSGPYSFLLESVEKGQRVGRYSFVGFEPSMLFQAKEGVVTITEQGKTTQHESKDPLKDLEQIFERFTPARIPGLPPFSGGAVGYLGYDMVRYWERLPRPADKNTEYPDCFFVFAETVVVFDHVNQTMKVVVNTRVGDNPEKDYDDSVARINEIAAILSKPLTKTMTGKGFITGKKHVNYQHSCTSQEFREMVKKAKEYIAAGDIFQVVLSRKTAFKLYKEPISIYSTLRHINPSPYMFYLSFDDISLIGSSPEIMVKMEDGIAELKPIAGTRPRGKTIEEDKLMAAELLEDEKEKAEHLMLVDLGRNDLGRVSRYGSVKVEEYMTIENYSHVMHIVSRVTGAVRDELNCFDVLRASFPAGTLSGAPKIRAMEIIDELEPLGRGPYGGAVGYISFTGNMDTCITIRTLIARGNEGFVQAGAGIVADSDPVKEYEEVCNKAQALLNAANIMGGYDVVNN